MEKCLGKSAGGPLWRDGKVYLIDRRFEPFGWACPAGHVDDEEKPEKTCEREYIEEVNLKARCRKLLFDEMIGWNNCWRSDGTGHRWYVYELDDPGGEPVINLEEAKGGGWFSPEEIQHLELEPVWRYFFEKLGIIKPKPKWSKRDQ